MNNPNAEYSRVTGSLITDPCEDPGFCERYLNEVMDAIVRGDPIAVLRRDLRRWSAAAGFQNIDLHNLDKFDFWEMRFNRGTNGECDSIEDVERWLGYIARGCGYRIVPGEFLALILDDRVAARFKLQVREPAGF